MSKLPPCSNNGCIEPSKLRCSGCKSVYYCGKECQRLAWGAHKALCKTLQEEDEDKLYPLPVPDPKAVVRPLPSSDTDKIYLTGEAAGLPRLTARYFVGSVRQRIKQTQRMAQQNTFKDDIIRKLHRLLRKRQSVLDKPTDPAAYQSALGEMVNDLELWHILRFIMHSIPIPWLTLEEGHAYAATCSEREESSGEAGGVLAREVVVVLPFRVEDAVDAAQDDVVPATGEICGQNDAVGPRGVGLASCEHGGSHSVSLFVCQVFHFSDGPIIFGGRRIRTGTMRWGDPRSRGPKPRR